MAIETKNPRLSAAGRKGGLAGGHKGGRARHQGLSAEQRTELMRQVAAARWAKPDPGAEVARAARQMLEQIGKDGRHQRMYYSPRDKRFWHAEVGHFEEKHWMQHWVGNYGPASTIMDVVDDFMADVSRFTKP